MSHDLAFFAHTPGMSEAGVRESYRAYCEGTRADLGAESPMLAQFVRALELRYPSLANLEDNELDGSPWSADFDQGPTHLVVCMTFMPGGRSWSVYLGATSEVPSGGLRPPG